MLQILKLQKRYRKNIEIRLPHLCWQNMSSWSQKYKQSIDCDNPKVLQKAHCAGKKKSNNKRENTLEVLVRKQIQRNLCHHKR